jgi:hypothetical protein
MRSGANERTGPDAFSHYEDRIGGGWLHSRVREAHGPRACCRTLLGIPKSEAQVGSVLRRFGVCLVSVSWKHGKARARLARLWRLRLKERK